MRALRRFVWWVSRGGALRGGRVFFLSLEMFHVAVSLPVFQLSRPEGGLAALPGTRRGRVGGVDAGTEGEGRKDLVLERRLQMSLQAFRCNNPKLALLVPLKFCIWVYLVTKPNRFND